jgi:threonine/homoserine/homoserine lactone efflux protein
METALTLIPILAVLAIGVISPGPSFILVARTAVDVSRLAAIASAFGMASGAFVLAVAALLGLNALLHQIPVRRLRARQALKPYKSCLLDQAFLAHCRLH